MSGRKAILTRDMTKEEWLAQRMNYVTATDAGAVLGYSPYRSALDVYNEKVGITAPEADLQDKNESVFWGMKHEATIADVFAERMEAKVVRDNKIRVAEGGILSASLDRICTLPSGERAVLEIKTARESAGQYWANDNVPLYYLAQIQQQLLVTDFEFGYFAVLIGGNDFRIIKVPRVEDYLKQHIQKCELFWNENVQKKVPPALMLRDLDAIQAVGSIEAGEEIVNLHANLARLKQQKAGIEASIDSISDAIKLFMGENEALTFQGMTLATWKTINKKEYTVKATSYRSFLPKYTK